MTLTQAERRASTQAKILDATKYGIDATTASCSGVPSALCTVSVSGTAPAAPQQVLRRARRPAPSDLAAAT